MATILSTIPASDAVSTAMNANITAIAAQVGAAPYSAAGSSWALDGAARLDRAKRDLLIYLINNGKLNPTTVFADTSLAYGS